MSGPRQKFPPIETVPARQRIAFGVGSGVILAAVVVLVLANGVGERAFGRMLLVVAVLVFAASLLLRRLYGHPVTDAEREAIREKRRREMRRPRTWVLVGAMTVGAVLIVAAVAGASG